MSLLLDRQEKPKMNFVTKNLTNNGNMPPAIVGAIIQQRSEYSNGGSDLSASGVTDPPRIYWLKKRHRDEVVEDVSDLIWSMLGTAVHNILEASGKHGGEHIVEERFATDILGWKFSGQLDHYNVDNNTLSDYKITSVYSVKGDHKKEWEAQLNCLRYLLHLNGVVADRLQIVAILRDWSKQKAKMDKEYPNTQVVEVDIPVWDLQDTDTYLKGKVAMLQSYQNTPDDELPLCSEEDRWAKPTMYAVMKQGAKRATKLHPNKEDAETHADEVGGYVELREGESVRCDSYCSVSGFCNQHRKSG